MVFSRLTISRDSGDWLVGKVLSNSTQLTQRKNKHYRGPSLLLTFKHAYRTGRLSNTWKMKDKKPELRSAPLSTPASSPPCKAQL